MKIITAKIVWDWDKTVSTGVTGFNTSSWKQPSLTNWSDGEITEHRERDDQGKTVHKAKKLERMWGGIAMGREDMLLVFSSKITIQGRVKSPLDISGILSFLLWRLRPTY